MSESTKNFEALTTKELTKVEQDFKKDKGNTSVQQLKDYYESKNGMTITNQILYD